MNLTDYPTPRTDENVRKLTKTPECFCEAEHSRQLERELAEAIEQRDRLAEAGRRLIDVNHTGCTDFSEDEVAAWQALNTALATLERKEEG